MWHSAGVLEATDRRVAASAYAAKNCDYGGGDAHQQAGRVPDEAGACRRIAEAHEGQDQPDDGEYQNPPLDARERAPPGRACSRTVASRPTSAYATPLPPIPDPDDTPVTTNTAGTSVVVRTPATTTNSTQSCHGRRRSRK